jgi:hypothetical protein
MERANLTELNWDELDKVTGGDGEKDTYLLIIAKAVPGNEATEKDPNLVKHTQLWLMTTYIKK